MITILLFLGIGFFLLAAEVFLPGMIAGICGVLCLLIATWMTFFDYGTQYGIALFMGEVVFALVGFIALMKLFPKTGMGRKLILSEETNASPLSKDFPNLLNQQGKALTTLRPSGTIEIHGLRYDAVSEGTFIEQGENIRVVKLDGSIIVVRKFKLS